MYTYFRDAFFVLDIFHVLEHLEKAAPFFHDEDSKQAREFVTQRLGMLLNGRAGRLIGGLKQMRTKEEIPGTKRHFLEQVIGYLERNRKHMRYEICLASGYPISSGTIEGACRNLINDKLELTGTSWTLPGSRKCDAAWGRTYQQRLGRFLDSQTCVGKAPSLWYQGYELPGDPEQKTPTCRITHDRK
ncbi:MAG: hypothetical protein HY912_00575 [Desulfomonile tiedjei]|uniref:Uncharacterized protein n=1 Tax=Desulfomonile tiedjei TaxID=2358 RepID=A0A9D6Z1U1_9BACT|nr:hypothetical protein [Desulfomonile tiedjei]